MRVGKKIIFSLISIIVALIAIFSVYIYVSVPIPSNSQNKIVQISFDDVYLCIKDLKDTLRYTSVFQQPFFKSLKELHDVYGAVFSLYVYEKADNFVITEVPDKFRNEFIENSEWLKFGYHAIEPRFDKKEQSLEFERSFLNVRKSILHWAGKSSLAPCLRLHYYFADDSMIAILKKYARRAYIYDSIYYHKTDIRIERMECFPLELLNYQNKDTITLFSHEWAMNGHRNILNRIKLRQSIKWLAKNNYKFTFLE